MVEYLSEKAFRYRGQLSMGMAWTGAAARALSSALKRVVNGRSKSVGLPILCLSAYQILE